MWCDLAITAEEDTRVNLGQLTRFTLSQLKNATENFSSRNEIGRGGFGIVYKGVLSDGTQLAIKRLKLESRSIGNEKQFQTEVNIVLPIYNKIRFLSYLNRCIYFFILINR